MPAGKRVVRQVMESTLELCSPSQHIRAGVPFAAGGCQEGLTRLLGLGRVLLTGKVQL